MEDKQTQIQQLNSQISALKKKRTLFLVLGIVLAALGFIGSLIAGAVIGAEATKQGITDILERYKWMFTQASYWISTVVCDIFIFGGVALIISTSIIFSKKIRQCEKDKEALNPNPTRYY